jgi:hypothetical protein
MLFFQPFYCGFRISLSKKFGKFGSDFFPVGHSTYLVNKRYHKLKKTVQVSFGSYRNLAKVQHYLTGKNTVHVERFGVLKSTNHKNL